ncbi:MAG: 50S ribosomal protein L2 [Bacteroidetes bacterium]|nr:50S ribosomal protein L2 [Bacteroidota bacterium]
MPIKKYNPTTPGTRFRLSNRNNSLTGSKPEKSLISKRHQKAGRNNQGRMTVRYRGGGHKRRYRVIDFKRDKSGVPGRVKSIEYDPNRSAYIALIAYKDGEKRYIIAPDKLQVGDEVLSGSNSPFNVGNAMPLSEIPVGSLIHCVEMRPGFGAQLARGAGTGAQLVGREGKYAIVKLPSGEVRRILKSCSATMGRVSNPDHNQEVLAKAGRNRWKGVRPRTRGVAMNPIDHPMGGGEGRASGGHPRSRTSVKAKGLKTRKAKKYSTKLIITGRKRKKK